jgi:hypothetical protein
MTSDANSHSPPIDRLATGTSAIGKLTELCTQVPSSSTIIPMIFNSRTSTSSVRPSKREWPAEEQPEFPSVSSRRQTSVKGIPIVDIRHRLRVRAVYYSRL